MKKNTYIYNEDADWLGIRFSRKPDFKCIKISVGHPRMFAYFYMDKAGKPTELIIPDAKARISRADFKKLPKNKFVIFHKDKRRGKKWITRQKKITKCQ